MQAGCNKPEEQLIKSKGMNVVTFTVTRLIYFVTNVGSKYKAMRYVWQRKLRFRLYIFLKLKVWVKSVVNLFLIKKKKNFNNNKTN